MISNNTYFYLYVLVVLVLLIVLSVLVFFQVKLLFKNLILHFFVVNQSKNITLCSEKIYYDLSRSYFSRAEYFMCILLCESFLKNFSCSEDKKYFYCNIAKSYAQIKYWNIAEYYYLEALSLWTEDVQLMSILAQMYLSLGYKLKADILFAKIFKIDNKSKIS